VRGNLPIQHWMRLARLSIRPHDLRYRFVIVLTQLLLFENMFRHLFKEGRVRCSRFGEGVQNVGNRHGVEFAIFLEGNDVISHLAKECGMQYARFGVCEYEVGDILRNEFVEGIVG